MVFPSAESQRKVTSDAESLGSSEFATTLPEYFANTDDPDAFCNDLFPPNAIPSMVQTLLLDDNAGMKARCALSEQPIFSYFSSMYMWQTEVILALWGEDAPVSIDSFANVFELCDWLKGYEPDS